MFDEAKYRRFNEWLTAMYKPIEDPAPNKRYSIWSIDDYGDKSCLNDEYRIGSHMTLNEARRKMALWADACLHQRINLRNLDLKRLKELRSWRKGGKI